MAREFTEVKPSSWTKGFLNQFRFFNFSNKSSLNEDINLRVKGFQHIKRGIIAYMLEVPIDLLPWAESLEDSFILYSLISNYDKLSAKTYSRLVNVKFKKYKIKGQYLLCYPIEILLAKEFRKIDRTKNNTDILYANNFTLPTGKVDVITNKAFIYSVFRNVHSILNQHFSHVEVSFFEENRSNICKLVETRLQPFWVKDHWKKSRASSKKEPAEKEYYPIWEWNDNIIPFLTMRELTDYQKELVEKEELETILAEARGRKYSEASSENFRKKFRGEAVYPIFCIQGSENIPIGYIQVFSKKPIEREELKIVEDQLNWLNTTIVSGVHTRINTRCKIIEFSSDGASLLIEDFSLIDYLKKVSLVKFKMFFELDAEATFVESSAKIIFRNMTKSGSMLLGVQLRSFDPCVSRSGELIDGKVNYLNSIKNFRLRYSMRER